MNPESPTPSKGPTARETSHARIGLFLFCPYVLLYVGFMYLSAFKPQIMAEPMLGGVNLAIAYGFGLILAAILLALLYTFLCRSNRNE